MQLRDYSSYFQPEEFDALTAAYDAAWQELWAKRLTLPSEQVPLLQKNLSADHSGVRLQREARRRATERDCIARRRRSGRISSSTWIASRRGAFPEFELMGRAARSVGK